MSPSVFRRFFFAVSCGIALASCSGGGNTPSTPITAAGQQPQQEQPQQQTPTTPSATVASVSLGKSAKPASFSANGEAATLGLYSSGARAGAALTVSVPARSGMKSQSSSSASPNPNACATYTPPTLNITNPFPFPIVLTSNDLKYVYILILTKCNISGDGYNVSLNQVAPSVGALTTIGDAKGVPIFGSYYGITDFRARTNASYTFAANSTSQLSIVSAVVASGGYPSSTSQVVTFPPNTPTTLGSIQTASCTAVGPGCPNGSTTQTSVALTTQTTSGGSASVDCFPKTDSRFANIPAADIALFTATGVIKGACVFDSGNSTITLGTTVTFTITDPDPDTAHGLLEGPPVQVPCTQAQSGNTITATCPTTGPSGTGIVVGTNAATEYEYFLFGNDPGPAPNVYLSPSWYSVAAGTPNSGYTFVLPNFATYPVTLKIDGDVNNNLSMAEQTPTTCPGGGSQNDMTQVAPGTILVNCNSGHQQIVGVTYSGGTWQYEHNGVPGQNQDCDASCVAYAAIDLYDGTGTNLLQGDGSGATINGVSTALATINPIAINDPVSGALEDANGQTVPLSPADTGGTAVGLKVTEANINVLNDTSVVFGFTQPTYGPIFGLNVYYGGSQFVTSGSPFLPVGNTNGLAHLPYGVGIDIQANPLGGTGLLFISPPEPPGSHAPPQAILNVVIPQAGSSASPQPGSSASPQPGASPTSQAVRKRVR